MATRRFLDCSSSALPFLLIFLVAFSFLFQFLFSNGPSRFRVGNPMAGFGVVAEFMKSAFGPFPLDMAQLFGDFAVSFSFSLRALLVSVFICRIHVLYGSRVPRDFALGNKPTVNLTSVRVAPVAFRIDSLELVDVENAEFQKNRPTCSNSAVAECRRDPPIMVSA